MSLLVTRSMAMREMRMVIVPSETETRIWGRNASRTTKFRATLPSKPVHPEAWPRLLEALGSFVPVRAALVAAGRALSSGTSLCPGWWYDVGGGSYELKLFGGHGHELHEWLER
jgi:hypothetical protein